MYVFTVNDRDDPHNLRSLCYDIKLAEETGNNVHVLACASSFYHRYNYSTISTDNVTGLLI